ncbi:hypothetical protein Taro_029646 [Colocasia esculenta]|uniref:Uncharacterized protein n=1 Tax=Colocasia esculenta TaxID=4460 RepID=A0A843VLX2_COLES|nr:hypothetical protein [Colocasia esculenta]
MGYYALVIVLMLFQHHCASRVSGNIQVPALFVFGDSLVDDGNNNFLQSIAKADYYPYGVDFYQGSTGRFSNGRTIIDVLCDMFGISYLPPYTSADLNGTRLLSGVNYASAAAGILEESGQFLGERFYLNQQVLNFQSNINDMRTVLGGQSMLDQFLSKSIVVVVIGSNDYVNNYLLPSLYTSSYYYSPQDYANLLLNRLSRQLLALHNMGLSKFLVAGVGPLGCIPSQRATGQGPPGRCVDSVNEIVGFFNRALRALVQQLNSNHPRALFVYGNTYAALGDILNNPSAYGLRVIDRACCGLGRNRGQITCLPLAVPCANRSEYFFWDAYHPTEAVNAILAERALNGSPSDCYPMNLRQLAQLSLL